MAVAHLKSDLIHSDIFGFGTSPSYSYDSGSTGSDRLLVVTVCYENGGEPNISDITYGGVSLTKQRKETVSAADEFSESVEVWTLVAPVTGTNTLALTTSVGGTGDHEGVVLAAVYTGVNQTTPVSSTNSIARPLSNDGTMSLTITSGGGGVWSVVKDRAGTSNLTAATDNTRRVQEVFGENTNGLTVAIGDRLVGSGSVTVGATADISGNASDTQDMVAVAIALDPAGAGTVTGDGALQAQQATISGAGTITRVGSGALQAQQATVSGSGSVTAAPVDITLVGSTSEFAVSSSVTSITTDKPAGAVEDDVAIVVATADGGVEITLPAGFTELFEGDVPSTAVGATRIAIGYKVLGPSEPADYTATLASNDGCTISCSVWRDVDTDVVLDTSFAHTVLDSATDPCPPCPSVTTQTDGAAVITLVSAPRGPASGDMIADDMYTPPGGVTEIVDVNYAAGTSYTGHGLGWETQETAGSTGTRTWSYIDNDEGGFAATIALRPASGGTTGSGSLQAQQASVSGAGTITREGSGALQAQQATVSGSGTREVTGSGAVQAGQAAVDGAGDVSSPATITGDGALQAQQATLSGSGSVGDLVSGSGALQAQQATVSGSGTREVTGAGTVAAQIAQVAGEGTREVTGSGTLQAQQASVQGEGGPLITGLGTLQAQQASVSGSGTVAAAIRTGEGALQAQPAAMSGTGLRKIVGSGTMVANSATVNIRPWIVHHTTDAMWVEQSTPGSTWEDQ